MSGVVTVRIPTGLPKPDGGVEFRTVEFLHRAGKTVADYLADCELDEASVSHVVYGGEVLHVGQRPTIDADAAHSRVKRRNWIARVLQWLGITRRPTAISEAPREWRADEVIPLAGTTIDVAIRVEGKYGALIGGLAGMVVGYMMANPMLAYQSFQFAMAGWAIGSTIGSFFVPTPDSGLSKEQEAASRSYLWRGRDNVDREGATVPVVVGRTRTGVVRVGAFIRRETGRERLYLLGLVSKGKIKSISNVELNDQAAANFEGVTIETRLGEYPQQPMKGFDVVANTFAQNADLVAGPLTYTTQTEVDSVEILFTLPGVFHIDDTGQTRMNTVRWRARIRRGTDAFGPWQEFSYSGGSRSTVLREARFENLTRGFHTIEVAFVSADETDGTRDGFKVYCTGVTEEVDEQLSYDGYALVGVKAVATEQLSGSIPNITVLAEGLELPTWNGSAFTAPTFALGNLEVARNPAWVALEALRNRSYKIGDYQYDGWGGGDWIDDDSIDLDSFLVLANRADEAVHVVRDDGTEYDEPRFRFDDVLGANDTDEELIPLVNRILSTCRATLAWSGGRWRAVAEMPRTPSQMFTMADTVKDSIEVAFESDRSITAHTVEFSDEENDYRPATQYVAGPGVTEFGAQNRSTSFPMRGVTRRSQAVRETLYDLRKRWYIRRSVSFDASMYAVLTEAGDQFLLAHDLTGWSWSGTVLEGSTTSYINLGRVVELLDGEVYQIRVRPADGSDDDGELVTIADGAGQWAGVELATPLSRAPQPGERWMIGRKDLVGKPFNCVAITRGEKATRRVIHAVEYNESIENDSATVVIPRYAPLPNFMAPPPPITEAIVSEEPNPRAGRVWVILDWTPPKSQATFGIYDEALVEISFDGVSFERRTREERQYRLEVPTGTHIWFRLTPISERGVMNLTSRKVVDFTTSGTSVLPPAVTGLVGRVHEGAYVLTWDDSAPDCDYVIRTDNPADWETAPQAGVVFAGRTLTYTHPDPPSRTVTYYARARNGLGVFSAGAANFSMNDAPPAAPTINSVTSYKNALKIKVSPPAGNPDIYAIYLHASQVAGFVPSAANRVAGVVGPSGGEFTLNTDLAGVWYFKATCADWLSNRMGDWVYSAQASGKLVIIAPVNPSNVVLTAEYEVDGSAGLLLDSETGQSRPSRKRKAMVNWQHADAVNPAQSLIGFEVVLFDNVRTTDDNPLFTSGVLANPDKRAFMFADISVPDGVGYIAAVKAVYVDGFTSNFIGSDSVEYPEDENPILRDSDDRRVAAYADSFDMASLTGTGFAVVNASYGLIQGVLTLDPSYAGVGSLELDWDIATWVAWTGKDMRRGGAANAIIRVKCEHPGSLLRVSTSALGSMPVEVPMLSNNAYHQYVVPVGNVPAAGAFSVYFQFANVDGEYPVFVTGVALAFDSVDLELDGSVEKGIRARQQYAVDPDGDGLYGISPIRLTDGEGNVIAVEEDGLYYLRDENGTLISETAYKLGRNSRISEYTHNVWIPFGAAGVGDWGLGIPIPEPVSYDKARFITQDVGTESMPLNFTSGQVIRKWFEAHSFGTYVGEPGFVLAGMYFIGGILGTHSVPLKGVTTTQEAKSTLGFSATNAATTDAVNDGWYYVANDAGLPSNWASGNWDWYFRTVVWVEIAMPVSKRADGSFHHVDLEFTVRTGAATTDGTKMNLGASPLTNGPFKVRRLADGGTTLVPIVIGQLNSTAQLASQNVKVDWHGRTWEVGGSGAISCCIHHVDFTYIDGVSSYSQVIQTDLGFTWLEEHGG